MQCDDMQALDLLSKSGAISVWLCWSLSVEPTAKGGCFEVIPSDIDDGNLQLQVERPRFNASRSGNIRFEDCRVQSAAFSMLPVYDKYATDKRELQGEIHLASNLPIPTHLAGFHFQVRRSIDSRENLIDRINSITYRCTRRRPLDSPQSPQGEFRPLTSIFARCMGKALGLLNI